MKNKNNIIKKIICITMFINSLIIVGQDSKQTNYESNKKWNSEDYITFAEKAVYDNYKLEANKIRLYDKIDLWLKYNRIDENKFNEFKKRIEDEEDILLTHYKEEIEFEISNIKSFCEKNIVNLFYTPQEKKIEYILQRIKQDFSYFYNDEITYLETNPINEPSSLPNNGSDVVWSIEDYDNFLKSETEKCPNLLIKKKDEAQKKLDKAINKLKSDKYSNELNKVSVDENEYKQSIKNLESEYQKQIENLKSFCIEQLEKYTKYRDEWVAYLKVKPIYDNLSEKNSRAKLEIDEQNRRNRLEFEEAEKVKQNKIDQELSNKKTKEVLNSAEYKNWKEKYISIINLADANILVINNLEKKYSFTNNFGNKVWDANRFSKQDKLTYNNNYEAIGKKLDAVRELQKLGDNEKYLNYYENSVISAQTNGSTKGVELYNLSQYYNNHEKLY